MKKKIKILAIVQNPGAVAQVRIISPLNYLNKKNHLDFEVVDLSQEENNVVNYVPDIVILQRLNNLNYYDFIKLLKSKGSKIIFELDDNLLELPSKNPAFSLYSDPIQRRGFLEYLWLADHITVSTENLKHYYSRFNKSITVIPNQIDEEIFDNNSIRITNKSKVRIGFAGTTTHQEDFEQVIPALKRITENYKNKAELVFINMIPKDFIEYKTVKYIPGTGYLSSFAKLLIESRIDIGLAPLSFNRFNMAKSDIKFLEYAKSGIAGIYSNFGPYKRSIIDDENGLLINFENSNEWFYKLEHLINNPNKIDIIKKNALKYVNCNRTIAQNHRNWLNVYLELLGNSKKSEINQNIKIEEKTVYTVNKHKNYQLVDKSPKASIIILTHNQKKYTQECIESIYKNTKVNYELIIIDNNSTDETKKYLEKLQSKKRNVKILFNKENKGFPAGINQGILEAKTENIIITNNDIVVTENWLEKMIQKAESDSEIGIVGPISNSVSGVQLDKNAKYNSIEEMYKYAETVSASNKGLVEQFPRVAFLCTLIKKEVIEKIGGLDERFSPGNFEDDDFCLRAQLAGYKTVIAKDIFIHHYGSISFKKNGENEYGKRLKINEQKFIEKWGRNPEGVWLKGKNIKEREIKFPINTDLYVQSLERAFINIDDEEYDFALENLKRALANFKSSARKGYEKITQEDLLNMAGNLALTKNELEEAKTLFEKQLEVNPNSSNACFGLGEVFNVAEMFEESKTMLEWAIINDKENSNAKIRLGEVNQKLNLPEDHNSLLEQEKVGVDNNA